MNKINKNTILNIEVEEGSKENILENIKKYLIGPQGFFHVVSLNPENLVIAQKDEEFREIITKAQIKLVDGIGVVIAGKILGVPVGERVTGVELMEELIELAGRSSSRVVLIGGKGNLAETLAKCYFEKYGQGIFVGTEGIKDINNPTKEEEAELFSIVARVRPQFVFVAFGSPWQEKWFWRNRALLQGVVCIGVGGAFDYLAGNVVRPSQVVRRVGLEWLFRLLNQPWRWKRQIRLFTFLGLVAKEKLLGANSANG